MDLIKQGLEFVMDILETIVFVGSLFIVVYLFIMQPNQIRGSSMEPTFLSNEYIFTSKVTYKFRTFHRGDIVVFRSPRNPDIEFIKRIIGLPGDRVLFREGEVYVNGVQLKEDYISAKTPLWDGGYAREDESITIPPDSLWVMGDNRPYSSDSREFGPIVESSVIGQVFFRYYPVPKMGFIINPIVHDFQVIHVLHPFGLKQDAVHA